MTTNNTLKILHVSDNGLPDWRIEKSALSAKKRDINNKVYFAGLFPHRYVNLNPPFDWTYFLDWDYKARYYYPEQWNTLKKQLLNIILDCKPDIIHAHDVFAMQLVREVNKVTGTPWVYDNHEYWSKSTVYKYTQNEHFKQTDPSHYHIPQKLWAQWELYLIKEAHVPMIVCSERIAQELNYFASNNSPIAFSVPNYPNREQIKNIPEPVYHEEISSLFMNNRKPFPGKMTPLTNSDGFFDLWNNNNDNKNGLVGHLHTIGWNEPDRAWIHHHGYISNRDKLYQIMSECDLGIIPWHPHPFHPYCHPNRVNDYAHVGLLLILPESLETVIDDDMKGLAVGFKTHKDLKDAILLYRENPDLCYEYRVRTYKHAKRKLLWELHEDNIFAAYNKAL